MSDEKTTVHAGVILPTECRRSVTNNSIVPLVVYKTIQTGKNSTETIEVGRIQPGDTWQENQCECR